MGCYGIKIIKNRVLIYDFNNKNHIRHKGEKTFAYKEDFWSFFKEKISYDNEKLSFLIVTDKDGVIVPDVFLLDSENKISYEDFQNFVDNELYIFTYPSKDYKINLKKERVKNKITQDEKVLESIEINPIVRHYREKTKEYESQQ